MGYETDDANEREKIAVAVVGKTGDMGIHKTAGFGLGVLLRLSPTHSGNRRDQTTSLGNG